MSSFGQVGNRISSNHVLLMQGATVAFALLVAVYGAPPLAGKFSHLSIKGYVNEIAPSVTVTGNPQALPGAMASPAVSNDPAEPDLALLDDIFVPASAPQEDETALKTAAAEQQLRNQLASVRLGGITTGGAFINDRFVRSGGAIGMTVTAPGGQPVSVIARVTGSSVTLVAGEYSHRIEFTR
ncbi:hypothetical protein C1X35_25880 [Pseudomonas sp. FW306-1C-G01A]|uniref:hypothetical protein n=1 Tax=unclassified Pseudomonas TaxID=196821 RepID=UPI000C86C668|nr:MULTISPECIES: hypothetical protein [unclassified Pseudomonas]PMV85963.1 hypothetical protein C1X51_29665 [Pseudomonas sp. FW306-2-2C-B10A]PMV86775.1 hypothetical protein C1X56_14100 [Pseudomonas sp. GW101-1A09]PMW00628.1 hypothetical protein C1X50_28245 [Pseudomonas sp. MPR-TSA4]PMW12581.1 hypothetical protein C1X52_19200 [Pseudomonas sp. FW306-2-1A-C05A]PMW29411.1 hypothetical protein C1X48_30210 [Pseudomonas sp. FW305-3-2-15-A-R2A1]